MILLEIRVNMDATKTLIDVKNNAIIFTFNQDDTFDRDILIKMENAFLELDPTKVVEVQLKGSAPMESVAYCAEVAAHCDMILTLSSEESIKFIRDLQQTNPTTIKLIQENENGTKRNSSI